MELMPSLCIMIGHRRYYCQLSTSCQILRYTQSITIQAAFVSRLRYGQEIPIPKLTISNCPHYMRLTMDCKSDHCLWVEHNITKRFQSQNLLLSVVYKITDSCRLTMHHKLFRYSHRKEI